MSTHLKNPLQKEGILYCTRLKFLGNDGRELGSQHVTIILVHVLYTVTSERTNKEHTNGDKNINKPIAHHILLMNEKG